MPSYKIGDRVRVRATDLLRDYAGRTGTVINTRTHEGMPVLDIQFDNGKEMAFFAIDVEKE